MKTHTDKIATPGMNTTMNDSVGLTVFLHKFKNCGLSTDRLMTIYESEDVTALMDLPTTAIWLVTLRSDMISQSLAFAFRYMCVDMGEYVNLMVFGSMNEIRQVYTTMDKRVEMQLETTDSHEAMRLFVDTHPYMFMDNDINAERGMILSAFNVMKLRVNAYINMITRAEKVADATRSMIEGNDTTMGAYEKMCRAAYMVQNEQVATKAVPAKSWRP